MKKKKMFEKLFQWWMSLGYDLRKKGWNMPKFIYKPILNFLANQAYKPEDTNQE